MKQALHTARLPLLIIVSGAPGSGKTTFARKLAQHMCLVHLERDAFFESLNFTAGSAVDRASIGIPLFYETVADLLKRGVSLIIDCTLYKGKSEQDILQLQPYTRLANIHCRANNTDQRFRKRHIQEAGGMPDWLDGHMTHLEKIRPLVIDPLDLGCPVIEVETTDKYEPGLADIAQRIHNLLP